MPRKRRADAPNEAAAQIDAQASTPETPAPAAPATAPKTPRTRRAKVETAPETPAAETTAARTPRGRRAARPTPETEAPVTAEAGTSDTASVRRPGGRRTKTPAAEAISVDMEAPVAPAPVEVSNTTPRRGRGRRTETSHEPPAAAAESVPAQTEEETPAARRRGRGRRTPSPEAIAPMETAPEVAAPAPSRSSRSRRKKNVVSETLPDVEAPVVESPADTGPAQNTPPPLSPRRRRGRQTTESPAVPAALVESGEAVGESEPAAPEAEGEAGSRGRRGRRSRRRRGDDAVDANMTEGELIDLGEAVSTPEDDLELDLGLPLIAEPLPVYVAPRVVPPVQPPAGGALLPRTAAQVAFPENGRGLPQIVAGDTAHAPFFFFVNTETAVSGDVVDDQIKAAAAAGIHLYSGVMYLPLRNAYGDRSFGATDALIQQILASDPEAHILPRLQCVPTNFWARTHEDQMATYADGSAGDVSMASAEFWADCTDALEALIAHLADPATPGGDRVIGFHLDRGEWFYDREAGPDYSAPNVTAFQNWLHARYQQPFALRAAWFNGTVTFDDAAVPPWTPQPPARAETQPVYATARDACWPDYALYASALVADVISGLAEAVKTLSENRLLVAVSYGYTLEFANRGDSGHLALAALLQSPFVDILAGPNSYASREAGSAAAFPAPVDSAALHGKLWLVEDDTKTFLAETETDDTYNPKIASGADTQAVHQRHFGAAIAHGAGVTWMDLWGQGWLNEPEIWRELGILRDQANRLAQTGTPAAPDVAVLVDEASLAYLRSSPNGLGQSLVTRTRDLLLRTGASIGFYLQSDVAHANFPEAKLYLFLNALRVTTGERAAIREKLQKRGKTLAWVYAPGLFDENGLAENEIGETVGMGLRLQPWNARMGSQITEARHPLTERLRGGKKVVGLEEVLNPSFAVTDPQATVLAEYISTGAASLAVREHPAGWKSVFFGDPHLTVELLRGLFAFAGVPLYDTQDDITYAGASGVLAIHAPFTGQRTLSFARPTTVYDATEDRIVAVNTRSFRTFLRARTTRLFLYGEADAIAGATGLPLPAGEPAPYEPAGTEENLTPPPAAPSEAATLVAELLAPPDDDAAAQMEAFAHDDGDYDSAELDPASEAGEDDPASDDTRPSAPRSRWQRRRAALRARREAERTAQASAAPAGEPSAPVDIATLMPGLPPRRLPPPLSSRPAPEDSGQEDE